MSPLTVDRLRALVPSLDELGPLLDRAIEHSMPDPARAWAGSGELGTYGARLVDPRRLLDCAEEVADREREHLALLYHGMARAATRLDAGDADGAAEALLEIAALEEGRDRPDRAAAFADAAHRTATDRGIAARALRRRARARRAQGHLDPAEADYSRAYRMTHGTGDPRATAEAAIGAGNVLEEQGRWSEAEAWYRRSLDVLAGADVPERWHALLNLHITLRWRGELEASLGPLEQADDVARRLGDESAAPFMANARGQLLAAEGKFSEAVDHFLAGITASGGARARVTIRLNLAEALFAAGRSLDAAEEARTAEREAVRARLPQKLPEVYRLLGRIAGAEGHADAFVLFERALEIIEERGLPELERALTLQAYAAERRRTGEHEEASMLDEIADRSFHALGIVRRRAEWADRLVSPGPDEPHDEDPS